MRNIIKVFGGLFILVVVLNGVIPGHAQEGEEAQPQPEVWIKIREIKVGKKGNLDTIELKGSSNLPPQTTLDFILTTQIFSLDASEEEKTITTRRLMLDPKREFQSEFSDLCRRRQFPPAIYTVKLGVSTRQIGQLEKSLPAALWGKIITQQKIVIGDLKSLIPESQTGSAQLDETIDFLFTVSDKLGKWVEIYNKLGDKEKFVKQHKDEFMEWQKEASAQMNRVIEQTAAVTLNELPYFYRATNRHIIEIGTQLRGQQGMFVDLLSEHPTASGDPHRAYAPKISLPQVVSMAARQILTRDVIFNIFLITRYCSDELKITYEQFKEIKRGRDLWDLKNAGWQETLEKLEAYGEIAQFRLGGTETLKPYFAPMTEYQQLLRKNLETYTALLWEEDPKKKEELTKTLEATSQRMSEIFDRAKKGLAKLEEKHE